MHTHMAAKRAPAFSQFLAWSWGRLSLAGLLPDPDSGKLCGRQVGWGTASSQTQPQTGGAQRSSFSPERMCKRQGQPQRVCMVDLGLIYDGAPAHVSKASC